MNLHLTLRVNYMKLRNDFMMGSEVDLGLSEGEQATVHSQQLSQTSIRLKKDEQERGLLPL